MSRFEESLAKYPCGPGGHTFAFRETGISPKQAALLQPGQRMPTTPARLTNCTVCGIDVGDYTCIACGENTTGGLQASICHDEAGRDANGWICHLCMRDIPAASAGWRWAQSRQS
jgi:hypothetical protein